MNRSLKTFGAAFAGILALGALLPGTANAVPHDGIIIDGTSPGARFSFLHPATNNSGGGGPAISIPNGGTSSADIAYSWNSNGDPLSVGATQVFDRGATIIWDTAGLIGGSGGSFTLSLWEAVAGATNTITAGASVSGSANRNTAPAESVSNLHRATGDFGFTITDNTTGDVLSDIFFFEDMGPNVIGVGDISGDIDTFLWGKTASGDSGTCAADQGDCSAIYSAFYKSHGLGIDIAYSGSTVPEPGALALLGVGLLSLGLARRRSRKS